MEQAQYNSMQDDTDNYERLKEFATLAYLALTSSTSLTVLALANYGPWLNATEVSPYSFTSLDFRRFIRLLLISAPLLSVILVPVGYGHLFWIYITSIQLLALLMRVSDLIAHAIADLVALVAFVPPIAVNAFFALVAFFDDVDSRIASAYQAASESTTNHQPLPASSEALAHAPTASLSADNTASTTQTASAGLAASKNTTSTIEQGQA